ncbi:MAG: hypothetical protein H8D23_39525 [Candidatus Brocadiales bacterium]|nr:hypothetical protein [Candidatus Brocadiales bacterium]
MAKLAFNKRCPYCKSNSFDRDYRKFWMRIIPKTKHYVCNKCFRHFIAMFGISDVCEPRKHRHYKVRDNVLVNLSPDLSEAFPVVDISKGGLSFWYTTDREQPAIVKGLVISHSVKGICLKIPSMIMLDRESGNGLSGSDRRSRKCRGKFINLTRKHKVLLQDIIPELSKN